MKKVKSKVLKIYIRDELVVERLIKKEDFPKDKQGQLSYIQLLIADKLPYDDIVDFYSNEEKYFRDHVNWYSEDAEKSIYMVVVSEHVRGYGTYRGAIVCSYLKSTILDLDFFENKKDFIDCNIKKIGSASNDLELGVIMEDYFNG